MTDWPKVPYVGRQGEHGAGSWSTPGGHLDFGASPQACAARESLANLLAGRSLPPIPANLGLQRRAQSRRR